MMRHTILPIIFSSFLLFIGPLAADTDFGLLVIGYAKDAKGNYLGHLKYKTLNSDWKLIGEDEISARIENRFATPYSSSAVVKPGDCYILYTQKNNNGTKKIFKATAKTNENFISEKRRIKNLVINNSPDKFEYIEDGCNDNIVVERIAPDGQQSFDSFTESMLGLTLQQGRFRCKDEVKSEFTVRRIRPGVYYFVSGSSEAGLSNGYKIPLDVRKALQPEAPSYYIKDARNKYHSAIHKMCESYFAPKQGVVDAAYDFISNLLFKMYTDCRKENRPAEECQKLRDRRNSIQGIRG